MSVCACSTPTPAGPLAPDPYGAAAWPLVLEWQRLLRKVFRRSIAGLSGSLSTLRRAGHPAPTQDSLPAAGQTLLDGLLTRRVPTKGFGVLLTSHPPFPSLLGAITSTGEANRPLLAGRRRSADLRLARWKRNSSASAWGKVGENIGPCGPNATTLPTNADQS